MSRQKKYEETYSEIMDRGVAAADDGGSLLFAVIAEVIKRLDKIWQRDKDGKIERNKNGLPKVNWVAVMLALGEIVGAVLAIRNAAKVAAPNKA